MLQLEITDKLSATLPGIERKHVMKFNNSWLLIRKDESRWFYLVAYRATVFVHSNDKNGIKYFGDAPKYQGMSGTVWGEGWNCSAVGQDPEKEGCVPSGRTGRYFDGIGIAQVELDATQLSKGSEAIRVLADQILENTDGYEDPRVFSCGEGNFYLHAHRAQPVNNPPFRQLPIRKDWSKRGGDDRFDNPDVHELLVKVIRLNCKNEKFTRAEEFYYGLDYSQYCEKNFGFFFDQDRLNAIYGLGFISSGFTVLLGEQGGLINAKDNDHLEVERRQPQGKRQPVDRECFLALEDYFYKALKSKQRTMLFSSSGPLIQREDGCWIGVGHVKVNHKALGGVILMLIDRLANARPEDWLDRKTILAALMQDEQLVKDTIHKICNDSVVDLFNYLVAMPPGFTDLRESFKNIDPGFLQGSLFKLLGEILIRSDEVLHVNAMDSVVYSEAELIDKIILHSSWMYFSFLYELEGAEKDYCLKRFSDAFIVTDPERPRMLQFATNLAPGPSGYVIGVGENDHHASVIVLEAEELERCLKHHPGQFDPRDYSFSVFDR